MKKLLFLIAMSLFIAKVNAQSSTYVVTSFEVLAGGFPPTTCTSSIIIASPAGTVQTLSSADFFLQTGTHEKNLNDQLTIITNLGYKITSTTTSSYGNINGSYYIWTRYILQN